MVDETKRTIEAIYDHLGTIEIHYRTVLKGLHSDDKQLWFPVRNGIKYLLDQISGAESRIAKRMKNRAG